MRPSVKAAAATLAVAGLLGIGGVMVGALPDGSSKTADEAVAEVSVAPESFPSPSPTQVPSPAPTPTPTPTPTPVLVPAPLTGRLVTPEAAAQHPIALMIDDLRAARPQSGFNAASVVWQAPAEGGIPRYMLIFQEELPSAVGPVRSARDYYIAWAAEWNAVYGHVGGSPGAMSTLAAGGNGQLVYNADEFRWGGTYYRRITERASPHNVYSDAASLRKLAGRVGAEDGLLTPAWTFAPDAPLADRPNGGMIRVVYPQNTIEYRYDRATNTYPRGVTGEKEQIDAATGDRVAPRNVVVMLMSFAPLNDGTTKRRLEAKVIGGGRAWIATNGRTILGTWKKASLAAPTLFFDAAGEPVSLTVGQTFIQVMPLGSTVTIQDGPLPGSEVASPSPS